MIRILKHADASARAIDLCRKHSCEFCKSQIKPHVPLPAKTNHPVEFNDTVGIDVKNLPGWLPNQKIKALNIVDYGSCYQLMIPFHERETSQVLKKLFAEHWVKVFGAPRTVTLDPAQTNMGETLQEYFDQQGIIVSPTAAEAHWQLGRAENHGGWFGRILSRVIAEQHPASKSEWEDCVTHSHVKNTMIHSYGHTPHQHVFGKNPSVPTDLMDEPLRVVPATAGLSDTAVEKAQQVRASARRAVLEMQDDLSLRRALAARPRAVLHFKPGDLVAYWRAQKVQKGQVVLGGQWYGVAVIIGNVGRNYLVAHRKQVFRVAPEQLRPATSEERATVQTPNSELLGIRDMIEGGTFKGSNFIDLLPGLYPDVQPPPEQAVESSSGSAPASQNPVPPQAEPVTPPDVRMEPQASPSSAVPETKSEGVEATSSTVTGSAPRESEDYASTYGPIRNRLNVKSMPSALYRPSATRQDDFIEIMREVVPRMITDMTSPSADAAEPSTASASGVKRSASPTPTTMWKDLQHQRLVLRRSVKTCQFNVLMSYVKPGINIRMSKF